MKRNYFIKYQEILGQNLFLDNSSRIIINNSYSQNYPRLKTIGIANSIPITAQFLYLYFLTKVIPFLARKHPNNLKYKLLTTRNESAKIDAYIRKQKTSFVLHKLFFEFMRKQLFPENPAIKIDKNFTKIFVWNAPLYSETFCIQTEKNLAVEDIPLFYKFYTKNLFLSEIAFFIKFFRFLKNIPLLVNETEVNVYEWLE